MSTEDLKQLAIYMGYEVRDSNNPKLTNKVIIWNGKDIHTREVYNPLTSAEQCLELMEKLDISVQRYEGDKSDWMAQISKGDEEYPISKDGKTINEAVTNAAIAAINE